MNDKELDDLIALIDDMAASGVSRLKIDASEELEEGTHTTQYHHGRCDINSPWACGKAFDVLE